VASAITHSGGWTTKPPWEAAHRRGQSQPGQESAPPLPFDLPEQSNPRDLFPDADFLHVALVDLNGSRVQFLQLTPIKDVDILSVKFYGLSAVSASSPIRRAGIREAVSAMHVGDEPATAANAAPAGDGYRHGLWGAMRDTLSELFFPSPPRRRRLSASFDERLAGAVNRLDSAASSTEGPASSPR
jgi:hypothetical protein